MPNASDLRQLSGAFLGMWLLLMRDRVSIRANAKGYLRQVAPVKLGGLFWQIGRYRALRTIYNATKVGRTLLLKLFARIHAHPEILAELELTIPALKGSRLVI